LSGDQRFGAVNPVSRCLDVDPGMGPEFYADLAAPLDRTIGEQSA
jgi:hypothetical protein